MGLDPRTLRQVFDRIAAMHQSGRTIILVEQNVRTGLTASTHGVVMESGKVRLAGSSSEILHHPEIGRLYLGGALVEA
jgi:branched-chain amino acid transport system ATP-binding protein